MRTLTVRTLTILLAIVLTGATALPASGSTAPAAVDPLPVIDGTSPKAAAASCWEIKRNKPTAASGTYWLYTPKLGAPQQFYCDMTTDGGGWVLVGQLARSGRRGITGRATPTLWRPARPTRQPRSSCPPGPSMDC